MQNLVLCLSVLTLLLNALPVNAGRTPIGVHCPTASVQKLVKVVTEKDCCGRVTTKVVAYKPVVGEPQFTQCRCKESKDSTTNRVAKAVTVEIPLQLGESKQVLLASKAGILIPETQAICLTAPTWRDVPNSPGTRPPTQVI